MRACVRVLSVCACGGVRVCVCIHACVHVRTRYCASVSAVKVSARELSSACVVFTSHVWSSLTGILQSVGDIYLLNFANNGTASLRPVRTQKNRVK